MWNCLKSRHLFLGFIDSMFQNRSIIDFKHTSFGSMRRIGIKGMKRHNGSSPHHFQMAGSNQWKWWTRERGAANWITSLSLAQFLWNTGTLVQSITSNRIKGVWFRWEISVPVYSGLVVVVLRHPLFHPGWEEENKNLLLSLAGHRNKSGSPSLKLHFLWRMARIFSDEWKRIWSEACLFSFLT